MLKTDASVFLMSVPAVPMHWAHAVSDLSAAARAAPGTEARFDPSPPLVRLLV